ncbi:hydantoinase B/oxoprolinase family protein [bacterium]|nr:hydantoinase B/oxoprolinase family protein [bacterium]
MNAIQLTLYADQLQAVCEEMGQVLQLSAYSPNIRERRDFSAALFDRRGRLVAQGNNIPVHLGSMSTAVSAVLDAARRRGEQLRDGDVLLVNDPFAGGTHLPDITAVAPFFTPGSSQPRALLAVRAHHADVGGMSSGSLPLSSELLQEGLVIPPVWLCRAGVLQEDLLSLICANSRTPDERRGDLRAQLASLQRGLLRLAELRSGASESGGPDADGALSEAVLETLYHYSATALLELIQRLPRTVVEARDFLELPDSAVWIRLRLQVNPQGLVFDFTQSDDQVPAPLNAVAAITQSAVFYLLRCLLPPEVPCTSGLLEHVRILTRRGSIVDAVPPAAVAGGNVETSQRIVDVLLQAWGILQPGQAVACSQGSMNNLTAGGIDLRFGERAPYAYYETAGGGHGASAASAGLSVRHSHMTNSLNTPIEALEHAYPMRIWRYGLRRGSGGRGRLRGGDGLVRELEFLADSDVTMLSQRRSSGPPGTQGGSSGRPGRNLLIRSGLKPQLLPGTFSRRLQRNEGLCIETPGGGGYGED